MRGLGLRLRVSTALVFFVFFVPMAVWAQTSSEVSVCEPFDHDGNGSIEIADASPLVVEYLALSDCLSVDFSAQLACEPFDLTGDVYVDLGDYVALMAHYDRFPQCTGSSPAVGSDCAAVDFDANGAIDLRDQAAIGHLFEHFGACLNMDLTDLRCMAVDYDGDARVTNTDRSIFTDRLATFEGCVGIRFGQAQGLWISNERLMSLPTAGPAWEKVLEAALEPFAEPDLSDQNDRANTTTLAKALVGVRLSREDLIDDVLAAVRGVTDDESEGGGDTLALGRELLAYVLAADLIRLVDRDPALDSDFRERLRALRQMELRGRTLVSTHADRPNNWGTHAGATRIAIALYLGDDVDLADAVAVHRGWLGERSAYADFRYGSLSWQSDPSRPVGIDPRGTSRNGIDLDGALPEEMRRGGSLASPPGRTGYPWEALQGAVVATELLARNGYPDAWSWGDDALLRAVDYLGRLDDRHGGWWATGDDRWIVWLVNRATGVDFDTQVGVSVGKNMGFTDWTHAD